MTLKEFREKTKDLPEDTIIALHQDGIEYPANWAEIGEFLKSNYRSEMEFKSDDYLDDEYFDGLDKRRYDFLGKAVLIT